MKRLDRSREIERNEIKNREHPLYSPSDRKVSRICRALKGLTKASIQHVSKAKGSSMDQGYVEELSRGQKLF